MASNNDENGNGNSGGGGGKDHHKLDKQIQKQLKERKQEMILFERFKRIATVRLESMTRQSEETKVKFSMGDSEKQVFQQMHGMGIKEGIAAGLVTFFVLRRGPIYIARWVYKRRLAQQHHQHQHQPHQTTSAATKTGMTPPPGDGSYQLSNPNSKNPFQVAQRTDFPRSGNIVVRTIWFAFDSVLSLMMAASVSMAYTDTDKIRDQLIGLPLLPGRSLTSDALCDDIVRELQKVKAEKDPAYQRLTKFNQQGEKTPASFYLEGVIGFAENCQRRRFVEHRERQEQGLSEDDPVEIKEPIPRNGPKFVPDDNGDDQVQETLADGTFVDSDFKELDWTEASDFTTDQEEQNRSDRK